MTEKFPCHKCYGSGTTIFKHIENGVCFTCGGSGKVAYRPAVQTAADVPNHPIIPQAERATDKQWNFLQSLCHDSDAAVRKFLYSAGAPVANQRYVSRKVISKAIDMARAGKVAA